MTPPRSLIGATAHAFGNRALRRSVFVVLLLALLLLGFFPERYRAAVALTPTDPGALGLQGALTQLGAINSVFGQQAAIEIALKVGRSQAVREAVIKKLDLVKRLDEGDLISTDRWLTDHVEVRSLRGGIVQIELLDSDSAFARDVVGAFAAETRTRLAEISRDQTAYKRQILETLVVEGTERLAKAERAYDSFRLKTGNADPKLSVQSFAARIESIRTAIKTKEVDLSSARQFATDQSMRVRDILAQIAGLREQLRQAEKERDSAAAGTVGATVAESTELVRLERELEVARRLYESFQRYLEGTAVEDLASTANMRVLEPPYVDTARQYNVVPLVLAALVLLIGLAVEFYELRPPIGDAPGRRGLEG